MSSSVDEEYKIWKKNAPFLYDVVVTHGARAGVPAKSTPFPRRPSPAPPPP